MSRSPLTICVAAALCAPALAQDSRPASAQEPALDLIGAALLQADQNKVLERRLLEEQVFKAVNLSKGPIQMVLRVRGKKTDEGISLEILATMIGMGERSIRYDFDRAGALRGIDLGITMRGRESRVCVGRVEGKELVIKASRAEGEAQTRRVAWRRDVMPLELGAFVVPSLADQGLPKRFSGDALSVVSLGRSSTLVEENTPTPFVDAGEVTKEGVRYRVYHLDSRNDPMETLVYAEGERAGQIHSITFDYKKDQPDGSYVRISAAEAKQIEAAAPIVNNELMTQRRLGGLDWRQKSAKKENGRFSDEPEQLGLTEDVTPGYLVLLRVSPDGQKWMAVAAPKEPGKTGKRYFAINQEGKVHASDEEIPLNDACTLPEGLKPVR